MRWPRDHALFVTTSEDHVAVAYLSVDAESWVEDFNAAFARIAGRFSRVESRRQARAFLLGSLSDVESRSCSQLAEQAGDVCRTAAAWRGALGRRCGPR